MTSTISPSPSHRSTRAGGGTASRSGRAQMRRERRLLRNRRPLGRYTDRKGRPREVIARPGSAGSVLVIDRDAVTLGDSRLVAHLGADEPAENAVFVCGQYLEESRSDRPRCRRVTREDFQTVPFVVEQDAAPHAASIPLEAESLDRQGRRYRLELVRAGMSIPQLRWLRYPEQGTGGEAQPVSVREAVACLESYEPVRTLTITALALEHAHADVSTVALRAELVRMQESPIVLNRRLREAVLASIERQGLSMSEIAMRCGRVKRDCKGNESGETSWLARRLGILPEAGRDAPTPWIHIDVLALIARCGLGVSPREVEA
jgi:hypothetical protein